MASYPAVETIPAECVLDAKATLGEGPCWREQSMDLIWVDIENHLVCCFNPAKQENHTWDVGGKVGLAIPDTRGNLILGMTNGFLRFDTGSGDLTPIINPEPDKPNNRINDGKCDPLGRLWAGTMGLDESPNVGAFYQLDTNLKVSLFFDQVSVSNGMAWSEDQKTFYYIDSPTRKVDAFDCNLEAVTLFNRRTAFEIPDGMGYPDGMCIDSEGMLWVALWPGWGVARITPGNGEVLAKVEVPVESVTSCCFGGANLDELFITTANRDLDEAGREQQPLAGGLFHCRPGVTGPKITLFAG